MIKINLYNLILSDYKKYKKHGGSLLSIVFFTQNFWVIFQYRMAHKVYQLKSPILKIF
jgi:serine O-acetyltransferase